LFLVGGRQTVESQPLIMDRDRQVIPIVFLQPYECIERSLQVVGGVQGGGVVGKLKIEPTTRGNVHQSLPLATVP